MLRRNLAIVLLLTCYLTGCKSNDPEIGSLQLQKVLVGATEIDLSGAATEGLPVDRNINLEFSFPLDRSSAQTAISLSSPSQDVSVNFSYLNQDRNIVLSAIGALSNDTEYTISISNLLKGAAGQSFTGTEVRFKTVLGSLELLAVQIGETVITDETQTQDTPLELDLILDFNVPLDRAAFEDAILLSGPQVPPLEFDFTNSDRTVEVRGTSDLAYLTRYNFEISNSLVGTQGEDFPGYALTFYTELDETPRFPVISQDQLLTLVQQQTFKYFWDFAHPVSGLARERNTSGELVTSGGSGFGLMAIIVAIERGFITRSQGVQRLEKIIDFLDNKAERFHGAWSHWLDGTSGQVIPFSADDDGGDLVETAFLVQGLLTVRQYLDENNTLEATLVDKINSLWEGVEWSWYTQDGQNALYWHWSPNFGWQKNLRISGYNEALIVYVLAAGSPTFAIEAPVYHQGWARNGDIVNGNQYLGVSLPLGVDYGGPLFFTHYSFLGLDPGNLSDQYANYWEQNVNHSLINREWCSSNPLNFVGYSGQCWGLTASDNHQGYSAHSPSHDLGVITPTAAISSIPYTPTQSIEAIEHFYYLLGDRLWGEYGFYDAFNFTENWVADSYLAIDQGPIIIMIENYRSGLLWDLFMSAPEVKSGLDKLGFNY